MHTAIIVFVSTIQQSGDKSVAMTPMVDPSLSLRLQESESRVEQLQRDLNHVVGQRDQANLDLASLQQALAAQREENSKKVGGLVGWGEGGVGKWEGRGGGIERGGSWVWSQVFFFFFLFNSC